MTKPEMVAGKCGNCGDGCGWHIWWTHELPSGKGVYVWSACADCNDDGLKPKPELCEGCGDTPAFCRCIREQLEGFNVVAT